MSGNTSGNIAALRSTAEEHAGKRSTLENPDAASNIAIAAIKIKMAELERTVGKVSDKM